MPPKPAVMSTIFSYRTVFAESCKSTRKEKPKSKNKYHLGL